MQSSHNPLESYKAKLIRENMPALGGQDDTNVATLRHDIAPG